MRFMKSVNWKIVGIALVLSVATALYAADTKISALAADATPTTDDLVVTVDDPSGTPANKKVTIANLFTILETDDYLTHTGDADTQLGFDDPDAFILKVGNETMIDITEDGSQDIVEIGDDGDIDIKLSGGADGALFVQGSTGNVGIGTASPANKLEVDGTVGIGTNDTSAALNISIGAQMIRMTDSDNAVYHTLNSSAGTNLQISADEGDTGGGSNILLYVDNDEKVRIDDSGNVGIGTTAPDGVLEVNMGTNKQVRLSYNDGDGSATDYSKFEVAADGALTITTVDADAASADIALMPDGNVGIGTTSPANKLEVDGTVGIGTNDTSAALNISTAALMIRMTDSDNAVYHTLNSSAGTNLQISADEGDTGGDSNILLYVDNGEKVRIDSIGHVGIGTTSPNQMLTVEGSISLKEKANASADTATYGQVWVHDTTPNELWFTDDAGTDTQISSHPTDAPEELYTHGPGMDWIGKRVQKYLGVIFWQKLDGTIIEETFDAYNARRKNVSGHVDLVKRDWDTVQMAKLRTAAMDHIIEEEVSAENAFEDVEITDEIESDKETIVEYVYDETGKVKAIQKPKKVTQGTGKFEKKLKSGISFDSKTGKFIRSRQRTEIEVDALNLMVPEMPQWMRDWLDAN